MINDLEQPAKHWLADVLLNFKALLEVGEKPEITIAAYGVEMIVKLTKLPEGE
jgi:hypothetical protein